MAHELQTLITTLFPRARGVRLTEITVDLPVRGGQYPVDSGQGAEHHAVPHVDHTSASMDLTTCA
jgi:hypothetical protein